MAYPRIINKACHLHDVWVSLTRAEIEYAMEHGLRVRQDCIRRGHVNRLHNQDEPEWQQLLRMQEGYVCEAVVWKAGGVSPIGRLRAYNYNDGPPDVGSNIEVKQITEETHCLPLGLKIPGHRMVVGVVLLHGRGIAVGIYRIPGYYPCWMGRVERWERKPEYWTVPQQELFPFPWIQHLVMD